MKLFVLTYLIEKTNLFSFIGLKSIINSICDCVYMYFDGYNHLLF